MVEPEPAAEPEPEPEPAPEPEEMPDQVGHDEVEPVKKSNWLKITLWVILGIIVLTVLTLVILGRVCPQWLDQFLYTPEELEILYPGKL